MIFCLRTKLSKKNKTKCPEIHCPSGLCTPRRKPAASFACLRLVSGVTLYGVSAIDAFFKYGVFDVLFGRVLFLLFKKLLCSSTRVRLRPAVQRHFVFILFLFCKIKLVRNTAFLGLRFFFQIADPPSKELIETYFFIEFFFTSFLS